MCSLLHHFFSHSHFVFNFFLARHHKRARSRPGNIHFGCMKNAMQRANKKSATQINHVNLWTIFSRAHSNLVCVFVCSSSPPIELLLSEWMSVCMFLLSRIIDFWYLAFASLHLNQTIQYAVACFFINRKLIFKCTETGTGNSSRSIGRAKKKPFAKKEIQMDFWGWLFIQINSFFLFHSHANLKR